MQHSDPSPYDAEPMRRAKEVAARRRDETFEITDATGDDLLGCEVEGRSAARLAARTMVEDGHTRAYIYRIIDGEWASIAYEYAERDRFGTVGIISWH